MSEKQFRPDVDAPEYKGKYVPYDIIKEGTIALVVVALLAILLSFVFGSPDEKSVTIKSWSNAAPVDFATTALSELNGTSATATYGAPYNNASVGQTLGPLKLAKWVGVHIPIDTANDFVVNPLKSLPNQPALTAALSQWSGASTATQTTWLNTYTKASSKMTFTNGNVVVSVSNAGPVPVMINDITKMAQSGALDTALLAGQSFYTTDYTKPLLFLADGTYLSSIAQKQHVTGEQWGMMNETGPYPGQPWLWMYTMLYQIPPYSTTWAANADVFVWATMMILTLGLLLVPVIPGIRTIPRKVKVYRLIWREYYES